jgi:hypothetical protein
LAKNACGKPCSPRLIRNYYARIRVSGKLIWKSLKTDRISVAKLRLSDFQKEERKRAAERKAVARGKMTFAEHMDLMNASLQESAKIIQGFLMQLLHEFQNLPFA